MLRALEKLEVLALRERRDAGQPEILRHVRGLAHSYESDGDSGGGARELNGALRVTRERGKLFGERLGQSARKPGLQQRGAGHHSHTILRRLLQDAIRETLRHGEVERKLDNAKVVLCAALFAGDFDQAREVQGIASAGRAAVTVPGGGAEVAN